MKNFDTMNMSDHGMWMAQRHGKFTSSEIVRLMTGADEPKLLTGDRLTLAVDAINNLSDSDFGKTGLPLIKPLREALAWDADITTEQAKYAFSMRNGPELSDGAKTYAKEVAVEMLTQFQETPELKVPHILWGKEQEVNAVSRLAFERDLEITNVGKEQVFVSCDSHSGSTPDGVIIDNDLSSKTLEVKCPDSKTHAEYIVNIRNAETLKETEPKYYWQMQDQMRHTGAVSGLFVSYDPRFDEEDEQLHVVFIERSTKDIALIEKQLVLAVNFCDEYIQKIKDATS